MKIFLTDNEVIELAYDALDMSRPDPDKVDELARRMDMIYNEDMDMYEDVEEVSLRKYQRRINDLEKSLNQAFQIMLKYQDVISPNPLSEGEHCLYTSINKLIPSPAMNCAHHWVIDKKSTVAVKRCSYCAAISDVTSDELWAATKK